MEDESVLEILDWEEKKILVQNCCTGQMKIDDGVNIEK